MFQSYTLGIVFIFADFLKPFCFEIREMKLFSKNRNKLLNNRIHLKFYLLFFFFFWGKDIERAAVFYLRHVSVFISSMLIECDARVFGEDCPRAKSFYKIFGIILFKNRKHNAKSFCGSKMAIMLNLENFMTALWELCCFIFTLDGSGTFPRHEHNLNMNYYECCGLHRLRKQYLQISEICL